MEGSQNLRTGIVVGIAVIVLIIGVALGSVAFPMTKTETTTQLSTATLPRGTLVSVIYQTTTQTSTLTMVSSVSGQSSYPTITVTWQAVVVNQVVPTCTTVSGKAMVVYYYGYFGNGGGEEVQQRLTSIRTNTSINFHLFSSSRLLRIQRQVRATIHRHLLVLADD